MEQVILVDKEDNAIGTMEKMEAHRKGELHRAFSVLLFNTKGELLLQKRAKSKYHSGGLWTNTCCSHPQPGESMDHAIRRRLKQEMGIDILPIYSHKFQYCTSLGDIVENEYDHIYVGEFDGKPTINLEEVEDWKYMSIPDIRREVVAYPNCYSYWFKLILDQEQMREKIYWPGRNFIPL